MLNFYFLKKTKEYLTISHKGKTYKSSLLVTKYSDKKLLKPDSYKDNLPVFGITISKKIGKANVRNLLKRRIKAILNQTEFSDNLKKSAISFYARIPAANASFVELKKEVDKILKNVKKPSE